MADIFSKRKRSAVMAAIRSHGNKGTELRLMQVFRANGITGWRRGRSLSIGSRVWSLASRAESGLKGLASGGQNKNPKTRDPKTKSRRRVRPSRRVRPDFAFPKLHLAVFVDGCFWHGCPKHATWPKTNAAFWRKKIARNRARDRRVNYALRKRGWVVVRVWEHALTRKEEARTVRRLKSCL